VDSVPKRRLFVFILLVVRGGGDLQFVSGYQMDWRTHADLWDYRECGQCEYLFKSGTSGANGAAGQVSI